MQRAIFASNIVDPILLGKDVSRGVRGLCIVDVFIHSLLLAAKVIGATLPAENTDPDLSMESEDVATTGTDVLCMPACLEINSSMQQLTIVKYSTSEQHKEATISTKFIHS